MTYGKPGGMIATMNELHPTATDLAKAEAEYVRAVARLAALRDTRRTRKAEHRAALIEAIKDSPDVTHVDIAARFGVTEGTIRNLRRELAAGEP